ncbi:hypothetical protein BC332_28406 [Capsicum chinense]|nr:hypothetical protein BC332_28406 [Capsicum chinense]
MLVEKMTRRSATSPPPIIVTSASGIQQHLGPIIFGNFLPCLFQPINEETELEELRLVKHKPAGKRISWRPDDSQFPWRPQFSKAGTSSQASLVQYKVKTEEGPSAAIGPYTYRNRPIILRNLSIDFEFKPECLHKVPLWVKFPSLPLRFWSTKSLSKLASVIGGLSTLMGTIQQVITYDWIQKFCSDCNSFGYTIIECPYKKVPEIAEQANPPQQQGRRRRNCRHRRIIHTWEVKESDKTNPEQAQVPKLTRTGNQVVEQ